MTTSEKSSGASGIKDSTSPQVGQRVRLNTEGKRYLSNIFGGTEDEVYGIITTITSYCHVKLEDRPELAEIVLHPSEFDIVQVPVVPSIQKVSVAEIAALLETYRSSEDDEEVAAAQDLLLELLVERR